MLEDKIRGYKAQLRLQRSAFDKLRYQADKMKERELEEIERDTEEAVDQAKKVLDWVKPINELMIECHRPLPSYINTGTGQHMGNSARPNRCVFM